MIDWKTVPKTGDIRLEDGELHCYDVAGNYVARIAMTRSGLMVLNTELAGFQQGDPFKFRALSEYGGARGGFGGFSAGLMRQDGTADELASITATLAEDARPGERRAQIQLSIVAPSGEIEPVLVATSAYAVELFGELITWLAMASPQGSLLKFRPRALPPLPPPPSVEYPPGTATIAEGDFAALKAVYDVDLADEEGDYRAGRMAWAGPKTGFSVLWMAWRKAQPTDPDA